MLVVATRATKCSCMWNLKDSKSLYDLFISYSDPLKLYHVSDCPNQQTEILSVITVMKSCSTSLFFSTFFFSARELLRTAFNSNYRGIVNVKRGFFEIKAAAINNFILTVGQKAHV